MPEKPLYTPPAEDKSPVSAKEAPLEAEEPMDPFEAALFAAELGGAESIDLHRMTWNEARSELDKFLHRALMDGEEAVKIIHGRGDQILRPKIMKWLAEPAQASLIGKARNSQNTHEQNGVIYVALHRLKRP